MRLSDPFVRLVIVALAVNTVVVLSSCAECDDLLDCPLGEVCSRDGACIPAPGPPAALPCEVSEDSPLFDNEQGLLNGDSIWQCPRPVRPFGGVGPSFTAVDGTRITVSGSVFDLSFTHDDVEFPPGSILVYGIDDNRYFARTLDGPLANPLKAQLFVRPFADSGIYDFYIGIDPGGRQDDVKPTTLFHTDLRVIGVGSGDIQVNVSWDTIADVDLHVFSPSGEHVFFGLDSVPSGGNLDLDSNVNCGSSSDERNENIVWPTGTALNGDYRIQVNLFGDDCGSAETNYRVVVIRDLEVFEIKEGVLTSDEVDQNNGDGELVTTVSWPP